MYAHGVMGHQINLEWLTYSHSSQYSMTVGVRCSSVVRAFAHGVMGRQIDPSWGGPIELFLALASAPQLV